MKTIYSWNDFRYKKNRSFLFELRLPDKDMIVELEFYVQQQTLKHCKVGQNKRSAALRKMPNDPK